MHDFQHIAIAIGIWYILTSLLIIGVMHVS